MINATRPADVCLRSLKSLDVKAFAPSGLLRRPSEVTLSEAATRIAAGKKVTLQEEVHTPVQAHGSILLGWKEYDTVVDVAQKLQTPIAGPDELQEFADFRVGKRETESQTLAAQLAPRESGQSYDGFHLLAPTHQGLFSGAHKVDFKITEPELDHKILPSLSAFAAARNIQSGRTVAIAQMDTNELLQSVPDYKTGLQTQLVSSTADLT